MQHPAASRRQGITRGFESMNAPQVRALFYSAAVFNWLAAAILFAPFGIARWLGLEPAPANTPYEHIALSAVVLFGIGYWWAGVDPVRNRPLITLGMIGKLLVVAVFWSAVLGGRANWRLGALASGDLVYAALFARYLITSKGG